MRVFSYGENCSLIPEGGLAVYAGPIALNEVFLAIWLIVKGFDEE